jgi:hypothetical protein
MDHWFLVQTKPRHQARAVEYLERLGNEAFCSLVSVERLHRGRWHLTKN